MFGSPLNRLPYRKRNQIITVRWDPVSNRQQKFVDLERGLSTMADAVSDLRGYHFQNALFGTWVQLSFLSRNVDILIE